MLDAAIEAEEITAFQNADDATVNGDATRLLERDGTTYGAVTFEPAVAEVEETGEADTPEADLSPEQKAAAREEKAAAEAAAPDPDARVVAVLERDPGNPLGKARQIAAGTLVLFILHLLGLSYSEKRARRVP